MSGYLRTIFPLVLLGLLGPQLVHGIDGDMGNPYTDGGAQGTDVTVIFDGTLDYGGRYSELPVITRAGSAVLLLGLLISGTTLLRDKKHKSHV